MNKEIRMSILLTKEESQLLDKESKRRGISKGELLRMALRREIFGDRVDGQRKALHELANW